MWQQKVKAGALQLTLFVVVVIAILLFSFILLVHTQQRFRVQSDVAIETVRTSNQGMKQVLINDVPLNGTINLNQHDNLCRILKYQHYIYRRLKGASCLESHGRSHC